MKINLFKVSNMIHDLVSREGLSVQDIEKIQTLMQQVNTIVFHNPTLKFQVPHDCTTDAGMKEFQSETEHILRLWDEFQKLSATNFANKQFAEIYVFFKYVDSEIIYEKIVAHFESLPVEIKEHFVDMQKGFPFMRANLDYREKDYSLIKQYVDVMCSRVEDYKWLYDNLSDWRSKVTLNEIINYWFSFDMDRLWRLQEGIFPEYYDLDLLECSSGEVLVDCGAYSGDSAVDFINTYGEYKRIYCYELTPEIYKLLATNLSGVDKVILKNKGVGDKNETIYIEDNVDSGNSITREGNCPVELVTLDDDIDEPVTCIKMDIEGAEKAALCGARNHIVNEKPKLLISAYHNPEDIFEIPKLITDMRDDYKLYLRYDGKPGLIWSCDYVVYAL
ncbi:MAG: FkbM family methyltransferase [Muribaculaceae bacterium]|nr:FkbM family methyltransferase [Muribaculaceae bacterium]MCM1398942.1 FkbM family methyltransferase [Clostridium sp.]MCM1458800.1 FkbM family methyltransferase [Bacteroides sp.]